MALSAANIYECNASATAGNVNGGGFNPARAVPITNWAATDANTSAPVITSASYTFVAADVGHWVYVVSGTNWTPGWYQIASVNGGAATLTAGVGTGVIRTNDVWTASTVAGCATVASPTSGSLLIDYSQATATRQQFTNLGSANGSSNITDNSANGLMTSSMVGNLIHITAGTNFTVGWYEITAFVNSNTLTLDRSPHGANTASVGTGYVGGALSLGGADDQAVFRLMVDGTSTAASIYFIKNGTFTMGAAVTLNNFTPAGNYVPRIEGYASMRGDSPLGSTRPVLAMGANTFTLSDSSTLMKGLQFTGTGAQVVLTATLAMWINVKVTNTSTTAGRYAFGDPGTGKTIYFNCEGQSYRGVAFRSQTPINTLINCYAHDSNIGFELSGGSLVGCISSSNVTAALKLPGAGVASIVGCTLYGSENKTGTGILATTNSTSPNLIINNIIYGFVTGATGAAAGNSAIDDYNTFYNNTSDVDAAANWQKGAHDIALTPAFGGLTQVTGTAGKFAAGNSILIDTSKNFSTLGVVAGRDYVYISGGTGVTNNLMCVGITSISTTTNPNDTLNLNIAQGTDTTADKTYQITLGNGNFSVGVNMKAAGFPGAFCGSLSTTSYFDPGAVQRPELATGTRGRSVNA